MLRFKCEQVYLPSLGFYLPSLGLYLPSLGFYLPYVAANAAQCAGLLAAAAATTFPNASLQM